MVKGSEYMRRQSEGFSLVEVIIAIAILSIVAMALLSYFSNAHLYSSSGKNTQKADMAGQSVLEELNSCQTFDQIENNLIAATGSAWTLVSQETDKTLLSKSVTVDGTGYQARVTVDYDYSTTDVNGNHTVSKYNNYNSPQLEEVYSSHNIVLAESDQLSTAVSHFYYKDTSVSKAAIQNALTRDICLDVSKDAENTELYRIKAYYNYHYNGDDYQTTIKEKKIEVSELQNVYLFYNLLREDILTESVEVNLHDVSMEEAEKISLYLICQKGDLNPPSSYHLDVTGSGNYLELAYYTNGAAAPAVSSQTDIVRHTTGKRIAAVTVDVYREGETDYSEANRIVRLQTAKGA